MVSNSSFFKPQQQKTVENITDASLNIHVDGRADFAVAIWLIDHLQTTTHQKNKCLPNILLESLLNNLQENTAHQKPSVGYLTPIKYLKQLCLETDPNILIPALADILNQQTLEYILKNSRAYTSYFLNITPHTLSQKNIERNARCLNPLLPSIISHLLALPFYISISSDNKTLPKKHPNSTPMLDRSTGIKLHWHNGQCFVSTYLTETSTSYFKNIDITKFKPTAPLHLKNAQQHLKHLTQETTRSNDMYHATKTKLTKYMATEKKSHTDMLKIYFDHLNRSIKQPSKFFDTLHGTQHFFQNTPTCGINHGIEGAITRLLTLGEQLDMTTHPIETYDSNNMKTAPAG
tara:strand:- start:19094 stop:20137 length:1044 start_codon:yes stop_codon:yes gene_type:complete